jgi:Dimerisation domain of Ca+-activated chloride-channel, anoctamin
LIAVTLTHISCITLSLFFVRQEQSLYFQDGERSVDFVIAWDNRTAAANSDVAERRRAFYEGQLAEELHLESDDAEEGCALSFVKIHVPKDVLKKYAEILKVRMPMKEVRRRALLYFLQSNLFQAKNQHNNNLVT